LSKRAERKAADYVALITRHLPVSKAAGAAASPAVLLAVVTPLFEELAIHEKAAKRTRRGLRETRRVLEAIASPSPVPHGMVPYRAGEWRTTLTPVTAPKRVNGSSEGDHDATAFGN
jgi:hypothetical protein